MSNEDGLDEPYSKADKRKWKDKTKTFLYQFRLVQKWQN